jgi:hypothetical protein
MQTGWTISSPSRGWVLVDAEGIIRFIWRLPREKYTRLMDIVLSTPYVEADQILEKIREF